MLYFLLAKCIAVTDLLIKSAIEQIPEEEFPRVFKRTNGCIVLHKAKNFGLPFGKLSGHPLATKVFPAGVLVFALIRLLILTITDKRSGAKKGHGPEKLGLSFIVGGGISNMADRLRKGYVVDYFSFDIPKCKKLQDTIFNIGDLFIIIGSLLTIVHAWNKEDRSWTVR